jgi:hypothetical protein
MCSLQHHYISKCEGRLAAHCALADGLLDMMQYVITQPG